MITDCSRIEGEQFFSRVEQALASGVDAVLVREKQMDSARLLAFAAHLRELTHRYKAKLIIHTQADVAEAVEADGVHVAASDIETIPAVRGWLDKGVTVSASCHDIDELELAGEYGADFALLSPVFPTRSHPGAPNLGVAKFSELANESPVPVVALGGITPENRSELSGFGVAVISAILDAADPKQAAISLFV